MNKDPRSVARSMEQETDLRDEMEDTRGERSMDCCALGLLHSFSRADSSYKRDAKLAIILGIITVQEAQLLEPLSDFFFCDLKSMKTKW